MNQIFKKYKMALIFPSGNVVEFTNLFVRFDIIHTLSVSANIGKFEIYNLGDELLEDLKTCKYMEFTCGYQGSESLAFTGDIDIESIEMAGNLVDKVTKFTAYDGARALKVRAQYSAKISKGKGVVDAILDRSKELVASGITVKNLNKAAEGVTRDISGPAIQGLNDAIGDKGDIVVTDGEVMFFNSNAFNQDYVYEFTKKVAEFNKLKNGIEVKTHLVPSIRPGQIFRFGGDYKVIESKMMGDSRGGDWLSNIKGIAV